MFTNCAGPTEKWTSAQIAALGPTTDVLCLSSPLPNTSNTPTQPHLLRRSWVRAKLSARPLSLPLMLLSLICRHLSPEQRCEVLVRASLSQFGVAEETHAVPAAGLKQARWTHRYRSIGTKKLILRQVLITQSNYRERLRKEAWGRTSDPELDQQQIKPNEHFTFMTMKASQSSFNRPFRLSHLLHRVEVRSAHRHWPWPWPYSSSRSQCFAAHVKASPFTHTEFILF